MELISVIVPVYNVEQYLHRCVESIQNQTYGNLEIILVDDGSPDNCGKLCDELAQKDARIRVIHKENAGQGFARNDGMNLATGKYITFVDSDDWISHDRIENLHTALKRHNGDIALGNHTRAFFNGEQQPIKLLLKNAVYEGEDVVQQLLLPLIGGKSDDAQDVLINSSVSMNLYDMELIRKHNIQFVSERYAVAEDFYFNVDYLYRCQRVVYVENEVGYFYYENFQSTCEKYNPLRFQRTLNYYDLICKRVEEYGLKEQVEFRVERSFLMKLRVAIRHIVKSDLKRKEKFRQIAEILHHPTVHRVLVRYPIEHYVASMGLLMKQMKKGNVKCVYYLMKLREMGRHGKLLKAPLRWIGIGKKF